MQFKIFKINAAGDPVAEEEMNKFLRTNRILAVQREMLQSGSDSAWCFCIEYLEGNTTATATGKTSFSDRERKDYRKILAADEFDKFSLYRECRKLIAAEDNIPPYLVFIDEQLAEMAKLSTLDLTTIKDVKGIGTGKTERFGERFLNLIAVKKQEKHEEKETEKQEKDYDKDPASVS
jgi:superfamily II DNA helicase RecQ